MKSFDYCIFIGRFQPFHLGHEYILRESLARAETTIIVIGSHNKAPDIKNPWTSEHREEMIRSSLSKEENQRIKFIFMRDYLYSENAWLIDVQQKISDIVGESEKIAIIGHEYDKSSYYLRSFPQWTFIPMKNIDKYSHATDIRRLYFTHDVEYKNYVHPNTANYLEQFKTTDKFKRLKEEFDFLKEYHSKWEGAPFKPIFHTVDCVVIKSGHVLLVRRKGKLGKGLLALPGGFLNADEEIKDAALRELREETVIKVSKEDLELAIVDERVFAHPLRSLRGRTITSVFLINLKSGPLPKVKGNDDSEKSFWLPLNEVMQRESEFFEDHIHIIQKFVNKF